MEQTNAAVCNLFGSVQERNQAMVKMYMEGASVRKIGLTFSLQPYKVKDILLKNGVPKIEDRRRQYVINETYFDCIDSQDKAYILGFLFADGHNELKKYTVSMSLQEDDKEVLEKIRKCIGSERPLEYIDYSNKHDFGYTYKNQYRLLLFSSHMCQSLEALGMAHNKSLSLEFPGIPLELYPHFIRGYFDGDGSVSHSHGTNYILTITSTNNFCQHIKTYIEDKLGIYMGIYDAQNKNGITKVLSTSGRLQTKKFLDFIYQDATIYMERKHQRYLDYYYS